MNLNLTQVTVKDSGYNVDPLCGSSGPLPSPASCSVRALRPGLLAVLLWVITVIYLGIELEQGSSCFLLELIFCPTFISYCAFLWGSEQLCQTKAGLSPLEIFLDSL